MPKQPSKKLSRAQLHKEGLQKLYRVLAKIKSVDEAQSFLQDLFSSSEIRDINRRLLAAELLYEGSTYRQIEQLLGMGPTTINKIYFKTKGSPILPNLLS